MLRKIYIYSFIATFIFSTTGYTVTEHICKAMEKTMTNQMCTMDDNMNEMKLMVCCENEDLDCEGNLQSPLSECCEDQTTSNKVEDDFIFFKPDLKKESSLIIVVISSHSKIEDEKCVFLHIPYAFDSSPPQLNNNIYIFNSVLLI